MRRILVPMLVVCAGLFAWWMTSRNSAAPKRASTQAVRPNGEGAPRAVSAGQAPTDAAPEQERQPEEATASDSRSAESPRGGVPAGAAGRSFRGHAPRSAHEVALLFWKAPLAVSSERLFASRFLDAAAGQPEQDEFDALDAIVKTNVAAIEGQLKKSAEARHGVAFDLLEQGRLRELQLADLTPEVAANVLREVDAELAREASGGDASEDRRQRAIASKLQEHARSAVPDAATVLLSDGKVFVATKAQLQGHIDPVEFQASLRATFLNQCLSFFVARGRLASDDAATCAAAFEAMAR